MSLNTRLFFKINSLVGRNAALDFFGKVGAEYVVLVMVGYFVVLVFLQNWLRESINWPIEFTVSVELFFVGGAWVLGWCMNMVIGILVGEPRPHIAYPQSKLLFTPLMSWKSFPSDHAMTAWLIVFLASTIGLPLAWPLVILALWVSWGRVYAGVHYPLDIVGGAAVAGLVTLIFNPFF